MSNPLGYGLSYDATAPAVSNAVPERGANAEGWFSRPVRFDLQATDATSGLADCPPVTYSGPDSATASFNTDCRDRAGNTTRRSFSLKYDGTAPDTTRANPDRQPNQAGWHNAARHGRLRGHRRHVRHRGLHPEELLRPRQRRDDSDRHVHGPGRERR